MSIVLYRGGGAGDFSLDETLTSDHLSRYEQDVFDLLRVRGHRLALDQFQQLPWILRHTNNWFNDDFSVLCATVGLERYERIRAIAETPEHKLAFRLIAETVAEIGPYVRFIAVGLDPNRKAADRDPVA